MGPTDPIDLTATVVVLEQMVGKKVSIEIHVLPNESVEILRVSGVLGPHRTGVSQDAAGEQATHHTFMLDPDEEGLSFDGLSLTGTEFVGAWRAPGDRIVTMLLGGGAGERQDQQTATVKLTVGLA